MCLSQEPIFTHKHLDMFPINIPEHVHTCRHIFCNHTWVHAHVHTHRWLPLSLVDRQVSYKLCYFRTFALTPESISATLVSYYKLCLFWACKVQCLPILLTWALHVLIPIVLAWCLFLFVTPEDESSTDLKSEHIKARLSTFTLIMFFSMGDNLICDRHSFLSCPTLVSLLQLHEKRNQRKSLDYLPEHPWTSTMLMWARDIIMSEMQRKRWKVATVMNGGHTAKRGGSSVFMTRVTSYFLQHNV